MEEKNTNKEIEVIFTETTSGVVACCVKCLTCRNTCKQVFKVDEIECCGCKLCDEQ